MFFDKRHKGSFFNDQAASKQHYGSMIDLLFRTSNRYSIGSRYSCHSKTQHVPSSPGKSVVSNTSRPALVTSLAVHRLSQLSLPGHEQYNLFPWERNPRWVVCRRRRSSARPSRDEQYIDEISSTLSNSVAFSLCLTEALACVHVPYDDNDQMTN